MRVDKDGYSIANRRRRIYRLLEPNPWGREILGYVGWGSIRQNQNFYFTPRKTEEIAVKFEVELKFTPVPGLPGIQRCENLVRAKRGEW